MFSKGGKRRPKALKQLALQELGLSIQEGQHSSVDDARAALYLYQKHSGVYLRTRVGGSCGLPACMCLRAQLASVCLCVVIWQSILLLHCWCKHSHVSGCSVHVSLCQWCFLFQCALSVVCLYSPPSLPNTLTHTHMPHTPPTVEWERALKTPGGLKALPTSNQAAARNKKRVESYAAKSIRDDPMADL